MPGPDITSQASAPEAPAPDALAAARACLQRGDISAATRLIEAQLQVAPDDPQILHFMGALVIDTGDFERAAGYFNQALNHTRDGRAQAMSWNGLGHALAGLQQPQRAAEAFRRARSLDPAVLNYAYDLATALAGTQQPLLAIEILRSAAHQHPENPEVCVRLGNLLVQAGRFEEALELFQEALQRSPNYALAYFNASVALAVLGRTPKALAACDHALRLDPGLDAYYQLASLGGLDHDAQRLAFAEQRALGNRGESPATQVDACFAVARVHDHAQNYERAFEFLQRGNQLKRSTLDFSIAAEVQRIEAIIGFFTPEFVRRYSNRVPSDLQPIFIVGMPRCGSTLLEQMLAAHPEVTACGELNYLTDVAHEVGVKWWSARPGAPGSDAEIVADLRQAVTSYRRSVRSRGQLQGHFTDKMLGNFLLLGLAHLMFPRAAILHMRRDPMDLCLSCYDHLFTGPIPYAYELTELGQYYRLYERLMHHWQTVFPANRILDVAYEAVVENPEAEIRRVLEHCGLPFDARCLQHETVQRPVNTASHSQVRQPLYHSSIGRWRNYASHLQPLRESLARDTA